MAGEAGNMKLKAVGVVKNRVRAGPPPDWGEIISDIVIDDSLIEALAGLDEFSHIVTLCWMHRITKTEMPLMIHPKGKPELPLLGLFATRTPNRPNRIGETVVRLLQCQGNVLKVKGLDAFDGTPVIDIKPYIPRHDLGEVRVPSWVSKL
ncbi:MAG: tRNA (N6-threonylcarbamoyladenosine(37)-N6)-methyltransferase TrmO [Chloroflexota bacterium]